MSTPTAEYFDAVSAGDRARALALVASLQQTGVSALEVMTDVVAPVQTEIGELWAADRWSVAQEHAATAVSEAVLHVLGSQVPPPGDARSPVIVSCVEHEWHALPALMVAEHLRAANVAVSYLGANASADSLVRHVQALGPRAVLLSCSLGSSLPRVRRHVEAVRATGTPVVVGGAAFDAAGLRAQVLGATAFAPSGMEAVRVVAAIPTAVSPAPPLEHVGAEEGRGIHADLEQLTVDLRRRLARTTTGDSAAPRWQPALDDHLPHLVGALAGALLADDPSIFDESAQWLDQVLRSRGAAATTTSDVVAALAAVMREHPAATRLLSGRAASA